MIGLRLELLGKPRVWCDGAPVTKFSTAKTAALLYYLATTGSSHSRESLAGLLWGEMPEAQAKRNLTKALSVLRRLLAPYLVIEPQRVALNRQASCQIDVAIFKETVASAADQDLARLEEAVALYRGDFLEGFYVKDTLPFEEWMLVQRERLRDCLLGALDRLVDGAVHQREYAQGVAYARRLLEFDPLREPTHRQLMTLLARSGKQAAALAQYEHCRVILADELDVEPAPETTALRERIQAARTGRSALLPPETEPFVGRAAELVQIRKLLADPACRLVTVAGFGGIGKTRLALAAARQIEQEGALQFLNGIIFVSLVEVTTPDELPLAVANALDVPLSGRASPASELLNYLRNKELLLVLDNFEHLLASPPSGAALLNQILEVAPDVKLLVTSREPLQLRSEWRLNLEGLSYPQEGGTSPASNSEEAFDALRLFVQAARQARPDYAVSEVDVPHVRRLCQLVGGVPLAIKLAAAWLRVMPAERLAARVARNLDLLATHLRDVPPRQRSLRAVFDSTWETLSAEEQAVFQAVSIFHGGFTEEAATQVAGATPFLLASLLDRGLIQECGAGDRFEMHELTRRYAAEKLTAQGNSDRVAVQHTAYFAAWVAAQRSHLLGPRPLTATRQLRRELDNVRRAWQRALDRRRFDLLAQMSDALGLFYSAEVRYAEGTARFQAAAARLEAGLRTRPEHATLLGGLWGWLGRFACTPGPNPQSEHFYRRQLELAQETGDALNQATALLGLTRVAISEGSFDGDTTQVHKALALFRDLAQPRGGVEALAMLGACYAVRGELSEAEAWLREAVVTGREAGDVAATLPPLINLGYAATDAGRYAEAQAFFREALALVEETGIKSELGRLYYLLGRATAFRGDYSQARRYLEACRAIHVQEDNRYLIARADRWLGRLHQLTGDVDRARRVLADALAVFRHLEQPSGVTIALSHLGLAEEAAGNYDRAARHFSEAIAYSREIKPFGDLVFNLANLARVLVSAGRLDAARECLQEALSLLSRDMTPRTTMHVLAAAAAYLAAAGAAESALPLLVTVSEHPAATAETRARAQALLDEQAAAFSAQRPNQSGDAGGARAGADPAFSIVKALATQFEDVDLDLPIGEH